jgi:hypothetical protein
MTRRPGLPPEWRYSSGSSGVGQTGFSSTLNRAFLRQATVTRAGPTARHVMNQTAKA